MTAGAVLSALADLARSRGGPLADFAATMTGLPCDAPPPRWLPVCDRLHLLPALASDATRPAVQALVAAADRLRWQQTYDEADGFKRDWLDAYGWVNLVSPEGIALCDRIRVSVGHWGSAQIYPEHRHEPEEFYLVLAGTATFRAAGRPDIAAGPGDIIHHQPNQSHGFETGRHPLLAAAFWRGGALMTKSVLSRPDLRRAGAGRSTTARPE